MKRAERVQNGQRVRMGLLALMLAVVMGFCVDSFAIVSHAQSQGKVIAASAKIRKEPSTSSEVLGSTEKDKIITINNQVQGSDGYIWYQTFVNADTLGYIRSDLVTITDGTTPPTVDAATNNSGSSTTTTTTPSNETPVDVTVVNPVSATVTGGASVRIRGNASTTSQIVTTASNGLVLTVTGTANGTDGKVWYKVNFNANGSDVEGFIRSDFVSLSGELTPYVEEPIPEQPSEEPTTDPEPSTDPEPAITKDYDTALVDGEWYLVDYIKNEQQSIQGIFNAVEQNAQAYEQVNKTVKSQKIVIIILVFLLVAAAAGVAVLILKIKDMNDDAYFNQVEKETLKRRGENRPAGTQQRVMHTVGAEKGNQPGRPAGARPAGASQTGGQARPAGAPQNGGQARPAGARPAGAPQNGGQARPSGARPAGAPQNGGQAGTAGVTQNGGQTRPAGAPQNGGQARPAGAPQNGGQARPAGTPQNGNQAKKPADGVQKGQQSWQSKNFMADDDDEFEFEFLNYDGEDE